MTCRAIFLRPWLTATENVEATALAVAEQDATAAAAAAAQSTTTARRLLAAETISAVAAPQLDAGDPYLTVGPGTYVSTRICNPRFLSLLASYDVDRNICQEPLHPTHFGLAFRNPRYCGK